MYACGRPLRQHCLLQSCPPSHTCCCSCHLLSHTLLQAAAGQHKPPAGGSAPKAADIVRAAERRLATSQDSDARSDASGSVASASTSTRSFSSSMPAGSPGDILRAATSKLSAQHAISEYAFFLLSCVVDCYTKHLTPACFPSISGYSEVFVKHGTLFQQWDVRKLCASSNTLQSPGTCSRIDACVTD